MTKRPKGTITNQEPDKEIFRSFSINLKLKAHSAIQVRVILHEYIKCLKEEAKANWENAHNVILDAKAKEIHRAAYEANQKEILTLEEVTTQINNLILG